MHKATISSDGFLRDQAISGRQAREQPSPPSVVGNATQEELPRRFLEPVWDLVTVIVFDACTDVDNPQQLPRNQDITANIP